MKKHYYIYDTIILVIIILIIPTACIKAEQQDKSKSFIEESKVVNSLLEKDLTTEENNVKIFKNVDLITEAKGDNVVSYYYSNVIGELTSLANDTSYTGLTGIQIHYKSSADDTIIRHYKLSELEYVIDFYLNEENIPEVEVGIK